jgi:hypothetical protein
VKIGFGSFTSPWASTNDADAKLKTKAHTPHKSQKKGLMISSHGGFAGIQL